MTSAISCPLLSSVYECHKVECAFTSPVRTECGLFVMCCMQCCMSEDDFSLVFPFTEEEYKKGIATLTNKKEADIDDVLV